MAPDRISINRAPVLTLWAAVVAERFGFDRKEALSLGKAVAGLTAQSRGRRLGIFRSGENKTIREVVSAMGLMEAKKLDEILDIRRLTEGGFVEGVSVGG